MVQMNAMGALDIDVATAVPIAELEPVTLGNNGMAVAKGPNVEAAVSL